MFSATGEYLRIGSQLFVLDEKQDYRPLAPFVDDRGSLKYFEELASRGAFVAVGSRAFSTVKELQNPYRVEENLGADFLHFEQSASPNGEDEDEDCDEDSDDDHESSASSDESSSVFDEAEGYESWSEGSTDDEEDVALDSESEDAKSVTESLAEDDSDDSESDVENETSSTGNTEAEAEAQPNDHDLAGEESEGEEADLPPPPFVTLNNVDSDDEDDLWGHVIDTRLGVFQHGRPLFRQHTEKSMPSPSHGSEMMFVVLDSSGDRPKKVFQFAHPLSLMLYESPPVFHPHEPLVVWPLGAGDVLFADFALKSYFTRKIKASAPYSKSFKVIMVHHNIIIC